MPQNFSSGIFSVSATGGTVNLFGRGLQLDASGRLTGMLQDGTPIDTPTLGLGPGSLMNNCATTLANVIGRVVSDPWVVQALLAKLNAIMTAPNGNARAGAVGAFISQVNAQTGSSISPANAALLIQLVGAL